MYKENFENLLEELREKECLGMSEVAWPQKRYVFTKKYKIHLSCPLLQVIQGEVERVTQRDRQREGEKIKFSPWFVDGYL